MYLSLASQIITPLTFLHLGMVFSCQSKQQFGDFFFPVCIPILLPMCIFFQEFYTTISMLLHTQIRIFRSELHQTAPNFNTTFFSTNHITTICHPKITKGKHHPQQHPHHNPIQPSPQPQPIITLAISSHSAPPKPLRRST